jgi:hypothetical protein
VAENEIEEYDICFGNKKKAPKPFLDLMKANLDFERKKAFAAPDEVGRVSFPLVLKTGKIFWKRNTTKCQTVSRRGFVTTRG